MVILSQDRKSYINFDNVKFLEFNDTYSNNEVSIMARFTDGKSEIIGTFDDAEYGREVFHELMDNYRGRSLVKVPENRVKKNRPVGAGTAKRL